MKPPPFAYRDPATLDDALALLAEHGPDAKPLAGGQSLMPLLNFQLVRPEVIVDLNRIGALAGVTRPDSALVIGAMTRQADIERNQAVQDKWPLLHAALLEVAHPQIRNRGTIGGSLAHNDPAAELPAVMVALDATLVAQSTRGTRNIAAGDFAAATLATVLEPDELLTEVNIPAMPVGAGWAFLEIARRHGDYALAGVAVVLAGDGDKCAHARIVLTGVGEGPVRVPEAENILTSGGLGDAAIESAAAAVPGTLDPPTDQHASAAYRRKVAQVLTRRACRAARERCAA